MSNKRLTKQQLDKAKAMYMSYESVSAIAKKLNTSRTTLNRYVLGDSGWKAERHLAQAELLEKVASSRRSDFAKMTSSTITVLSRALEDLANRDEAPTILEAKGAANILETLDKITRLDEGNPTEIIHQEKPTTIIELKKSLSKDPFAEIEEAEYAELPEETD